MRIKKTLGVLGHHPTEGDRLVRLILAAMGRAEAEVVGRPNGDDVVEPLVAAARESTAAVSAIRSLAD